MWKWRTVVALPGCPGVGFGAVEEALVSGRWQSTPTVPSAVRPLLPGVDLTSGSHRPFLEP